MYKIFVFVVGFCFFFQLSIMHLLRRESKEENLALVLTCTTVVSWETCIWSSSQIPGTQLQILKYLGIS